VTPRGNFSVRTIYLKGRRKRDARTMANYEFDVIAIIVNGERHIPR